MLQRLLEVGAVHHEAGAEGLGRGVLVRRVALGHDDGHRHPGGSARESQALAVVPATRGDHALRLPGPGQVGHEGQAPAHLERAGRVVVLVLDPGLGPGRLLQKGPAAGRSHRHVPADHLAGEVDCSRVSTSGSVMGRLCPASPFGDGCAPSWVGRSARAVRVQQVLVSGSTWCTLHGPPVGWALTGAKADERSARADAVANTQWLATMVFGGILRHGLRRCFRGGPRCST